MRALWLVARHEFLRVVRQRRFLLFSVGFPLLLLVAILVPVLVEVLAEPPTIGWIDRTGRIDPARLPAPERSSATLRTFEDESVGRAALERGEIEALWIIPEGYFDDGELRVVQRGDEIDGDQRRTIGELIRANLLRDVPPGIAARLVAPPTIRLRGLESDRTVAQGMPLLISLAIPLGIALAYSFSIAFSAGFLARAVADEKENRLLEILATSTSLDALIGGKTLGLAALALVQILFWLGAIVTLLVVLFVDGRIPDGVVLPWEPILWAVPLFLLAYLIYSALMVGLGVLIGEIAPAQQLIGLLGVVGWIPIALVLPLLRAPSGWLARALSLFPLTAPSVLPVRRALGHAGLGELILALAIQLLALWLAIVLVARLFRRVLLTHGTRFTFTDLAMPLLRRISGVIRS